MKKINKLLYVMMLVLSMFYLLNVVSANEISMGDYNVSDGPYSFSDDKMDIQLPFARFSNGNINVNKPVNNMGVIFSNTRIDINEDINKMSLIFATDSIRVNSNISNTILFAGNTVIIDESIDGDIIIFSGSEITISEDAVVDGDIICFSQLLNVKGNVKGNIIASAMKANITGVIQKDLRISAEEINIQDEDLVLGDFYIESYEILENVRELYPNVINKIVQVQEDEISFINIIKNFIYESLILTVLYLLLSRLQKKTFFNNQLEKLKKYKTPLILVGTLGFVAIPFVILIAIILLVLGFTVIAIPFIFIYIALIVTAAILSTFVVGSTLITIIKNKYLENKNIAILMLVSFGIFLAVYLTTMIPLVSFAYAMYALGMLVITITVKSDYKK